MTDYNLNLKKFDLDMIEDDAVVVAIGRRRTGKSIVMKDLMYHNKTVPFGNVISATEEANSFFSDFVPSTYIFNEYKHDIILNCIKRQKDLIKKINSGKYKNIDPRLFIMLDDCMYDDSWTRDKGIRNLFMNGRHYKIFLMITMQYALGIPPALRTNIDYTIIMKEPYLSNRKKIYENYAGVFPDFNMFCQVMDSLVDFECLIITNNARSNKLEDQVFWYKANIDIGDFKVGCKSFWKYHEENYQSDDEEEEEYFDSINYTRKKNSKTVIINKHDNDNNNY